jgi:hypothetical protein
LDILSWIWWALTSAAGLIWSIAWFLLGGWVSTLAQIAVLVGVVFFYKYGWQRAPAEIAARVSSVGRFAWGWMRARETGSGADRVEIREVVRTIRVKEVGDVNISTLLSLVMLAGVTLLLVA